MELLPKCAQDCSQLNEAQGRSLCPDHLHDDLFPHSANTTGGICFLCSPSNSSKEELKIASVVYGLLGPLQDMLVVNLCAAIGKGFWNYSLNQTP